MRKHLARAAITIAALAVVVTAGTGSASAAAGPSFICHPQPQCRFIA